MSLADRKKKAEAEQAMRSKLPNGTYEVRLADASFGQSQKKSDMWTLEWKILKALDIGELPEGVTKADLKGRKRKTRYVLSQNWAVAKLLDILEMAGADLDKYEDMADLDDIFEQIEDTKMPKAILTYEHLEGEQYPKVCEISDVEKVLVPSEDDEELDDVDDLDEEDVEDIDEDDVPEEKPKSRAKRPK